MELPTRRSLACLREAEASLRRRQGVGGRRERQALYEGATDKRLSFCYHGAMNRQEILARLRENEPVLRARGVCHAALFGSRARGDDRPDSDIDIMVEFDPAARVTVFNYVGLKAYIAGLFDEPVDVVNRDGLKSYVRPAADALLPSDTAFAL
jgi:predicted nucleotidyltransferase